MRGGGYALELAPTAVDLHQYEALVSAAQAAGADDAERAVGLFADAEALWRGDVLADFTYEEFAQPTIARLTELRLAAIEERVELDVALGNVEAGIIELEALVAAHPLRERLAALMVALYRAGRQADALRVPGRAPRPRGGARLEPGPELRRLEAAILAHDESSTRPRRARGTPPERSVAARSSKR
jgi:DNA-binding SARP family transcriptional activator